MRAEIFARRSGRRGSTDLWMLCGYAATPLAEGFHAFGVEAARAHGPVRIADPAGAAAEGRARETKRLDAASHANLVTAPIWAVAPAGLSIFEIHARPICDDDRFATLAGVVQDRDGAITRGWRDEEMLLVSEVDGRLSIVPDPSLPDLSWTRGEGLSGVHTTPIWRLGEDEPWAASVTMAPRETRAMLEALRLRDLIVSGVASEGQRVEFRRLDDVSGGACGIRDTRFEEFLRRKTARGGRAPSRVIRTVSEVAAEQLETREIVREMLADETAASPGCGPEAGP